MLVFVAPLTLALATSVSVEGGASASVAPTILDAGLSKLRSGKAVIRASIPKLDTERESLRLSLDGFRVEGDPRMVPEALDDVLAPWRGKVLTFSEYEQAIHAVAAYLRENGHPGAQVRMSRAMVGAGTVMIAIDGLSATSPVLASAVVTPKIEVKQFKFNGLTLVPETEMQAELSGYAGKLLTVAELEEAVQKVAGYLRVKGYPFVQAYMPPQRVDTGSIEITVQEGRLDGTVGTNGITVTSNAERVKKEVVQELLAQGGKPDEAIRVAGLERAVLLASDLSGIKSVKTEIEPGSQPGTTQIKATVEESKLATGSISVDNYGSSYTGAERLLGQLQLNSPLGYGEQMSVNTINASLMHSARVGVTAPVGSSGLKLGAAYSTMRSSFAMDMAVLDLNSSADVATLSATYPWVRSPEKNINLSLSADSKKYITDLTWGRESDRKIAMTTWGAAGDFVDAWGGQTRWTGSFSSGHVDLSGQPFHAADDLLSANTQGGFSKINWQAARLGVIAGSNQWTWQVGASAQAASKNLDPSEKFQLGGPAGVRAYPVGEGSGDNGWLANFELRYRLLPTSGVNTQVFGFYDLGGITQYAKPWQNMANNTYSLGGAGVGVSFSFNESSDLKLMLAQKVGSNPNASPNGNDSDGRANTTRIWIIGNIVF